MTSEHEPKETIPLTQCNFESADIKIQFKN